jgi:hypothetical protein
MRTAADTAKFAIDTGMTPGVSVTPSNRLKVVGSVLQAQFVDRRSPIAADYTRDELALYSAAGQSFRVSNLLTGDHGLPSAVPAGAGLQLPSTTTACGPCRAFMRSSLTWTRLRPSRLAR